MARMQRASLQAVLENADEGERLILFRAACEEALPDGIDPWAQWPGEGDLWFTRFNYYLTLGANRSVDGAYKVAVDKDGLNGERANPTWRKKAKEWFWAERAALHDAQERDRLVTLEDQRRFQAREKRRSIIDRLLLEVVEALQLAHLPTMGEDIAREHLPTLRMLLRDLLQADRMEMGEPTTIEAMAEIRPFSDAEMQAASSGVNAWLANGGIGQVVGEVDMPIESDEKQQLLVVVGPDYELYSDLSALRVVRSATGLSFHRILNATGEDVDTKLRRGIQVSRPVRYLHFAAHMGKDGVKLADGFYDGHWWSERLSGLQVVLLAGCDSSEIGDWMRVVPHVVSFSEEVKHQDAAMFTESFWMSIGLGQDADDAVDYALQHTMPYVAEFVEKHW